MRKAKKMMEGVVEHGTATNLKNSNYKIAGKTGTAQIAKG
ncbi:MAG: penicillin-binding transpeptidase domain-containing protein [Marinilabiliales bacterium]|nr:penicillin-binding transpeptidase domain-containing protein [Marinilabiliales bacterium]